MLPNQLGRHETSKHSEQLWPAGPTNNQQDLQAVHGPGRLWPAEPCANNSYASLAHPKSFHTTHSWP
jgi:hypothetical protein